MIIVSNTMEKLHYSATKIISWKISHNGSANFKAMWIFEVKFQFTMNQWLKLKKECSKEFIGCRIFLQGGCMWMHSVNQVWWQFTWHCCFVTSFFLLFSNQSCLWAQRGKNHNIWNIFCIQKPLNIHKICVCILGMG